MNKVSNNHYSLLIQDDTENDGIGIDEEEEADNNLNGIEEEDEDEEEDEEEEEENEAEEDSDEEEIFSSSKHRTLSHHGHEGANINGQNHMGGHGNEYRLLNNNDADLKTVLDTPITIWTPTPMSPARRACFIASIMFGVLVVATFLWVLPCDVQPCEGNAELADRDWAVKIEGMGIQQTKQIRRLSGGYNVLLSYYIAGNVSGWDTHNISLTEEDPIPTGGDRHCGLLMLDGNLGRENWRIPLRECPTDLQCDLLDVSGDQVPDCIVRGNHSMVMMIEARYGSTVWHVHEHKEDPSLLDTQGKEAAHIASKFYWPGPALLLPDINNDSFGDLLFSGLLSSRNPQPWEDNYGSTEPWGQGVLDAANEDGIDAVRSNEEMQVNHLVLVSGQSGSILGSHLVLEECKRVTEVTWDGEGIVYSCVGMDGKDERGKIHLRVLLHQIMGTDAPTLSSTTAPENSSPKHSELMPQVSRHPCHITVHNHNTCPQCESQFNLSRADGQVLFERRYKHSAVVSWDLLVGNGKCHGAVLKIWEWKHTTSVVKISRPPTVPQVLRRTTRSSLLDGEMFVETEPTHTELVGTTQMDGINTTSESNMILDIPLENLDTPHFGAEEMISSGEEYVNIEPPTTSPRQRQRRDSTARESRPFEHPTIHRHQGKLTSGAQESLTQHLKENRPAMIKEKPETSTRKTPESQTHHLQLTTSTTTSTTLPSSVLPGTRTMVPSVIAPPGYQLQQIHERLVFVRSNGTSFLEETLTSLGISQLCKEEKICLPDMQSQSRSVAVNPGLDENAWQLVTSSTTFVNAPTLGEEQHSAPWILTSIVRKMVLHV